MSKTVVFGNSGAGKSTYAKQLVAATGCAHMDLDTVAWEVDATTPRRCPVSESEQVISTFIRANGHWVIEGCYADLLSLVLPHAEALVFLNPGTEVCIDNAKNRPWEPHKYPTPEAQNANLEMLISWIKEYEQRKDEFSLVAHRKIFDSFKGKKTEHRSNLPLV